MPSIGARPRFQVGAFCRLVQYQCNGLLLSKMIANPLSPLDVSPKSIGIPLAPIMVTFQPFNPLVATDCFANCWLPMKAITIPPSPVDDSKIHWHQ